jgi:hypothetical protein
MSHGLRRVNYWADTGGNDAYTAVCQCFWESTYQASYAEAEKAHAAHVQSKTGESGGEQDG